MLWQLHTLAELVPVQLHGCGLVLCQQRVKLALAGSHASCRVATASYIAHCTTLLHDYSCSRQPPCTFFSEDCAVTKLSMLFCMLISSLLQMPGCVMQV